MYTLNQTSSAVKFFPESVSAAISEWDALFQFPILKVELTWTMHCLTFERARFLQLPVFVKEAAFHDLPVLIDMLEIELGAVVAKVIVECPIVACKGQCDSCGVLGGDGATIDFRIGTTTLWCRCASADRPTQDGEREEVGRFFYVVHLCNVAVSTQGFKCKYTKQQPYLDVFLLSINRIKPFSMSNVTAHFFRKG